MGYRKRYKEPKKKVHLTGKRVFHWCFNIFMLVSIVVGACNTAITTWEHLELDKRGYYNQVEVGDYNLNISTFGNPNGRHKIVGISGLGMGDYSITARKMTQELEDNNQVIFIDRAGYGMSDDTLKQMTVNRIVNDYRAALKESNISPPYILLPHSIGGVYATYWVSNYPEEIEGIVFLDGTELSMELIQQEKNNNQQYPFVDESLTLLAKIGYGRLVFRDYYYIYPSIYSEEEQRMGDALNVRTLSSMSTVSEDHNKYKNMEDTYNSLKSSSVPKLYISSSWGCTNIQQVKDMVMWQNNQMARNKSYESTSITDEDAKELITQMKEMRDSYLIPYLQKLGNCRLICLGGDHMIYEQKPDACSGILKHFIDNLEWYRYSHEFGDVLLGDPVEKENKSNILP